MKISVIPKLAVVIFSVAIAQSATITITGPGGIIQDPVSSSGDPKFTYFDTNVSGQSGIISGIKNVTLTGFTHPYAQDVAAFLQYTSPSGVVSSFWLFHMPADTTDPITFGHNFAATSSQSYTFTTNSSLLSIHLTINNLATDENIPANASYRAARGTDPNDFLNSIPNPVFSTGNEFNNQSPNGTWSMVFVDKFLDEFDPTLGNLVSWSVEIETVTIPEPTTLASLGLGGFLALRRRRR